MKTSTKIVILIIAIFIASNFVFVRYLFLKGGIQDFFGNTDTMFVTAPYKDFQHIYLKGNYWSQSVRIRKSNNFKVEIPKFDTAFRNISVRQNKDTLFVNINMPQGFEHTGVWVYMPTIASVYAKDANCDIHYFRLDSLAAKMEGGGTVWLDEDTIQNLSMIGTDESIGGLFHKMVVHSAKLDFSGRSRFWAYDSKFDTVNQNFGKQVKLDIKGVSKQKIKQ